MKVYVRFKPTETPISHKLLHPSSSSTSSDSPPPLTQSLNLSLPTSSPTFTFPTGGILDGDTSQDMIYRQTTEHCAKLCTEGVASCVFAYGQTGSGKTYTVTGGSQYDERGLIPRAITDVFQHLSKKEGESKVYVSFIEVYQEACYDLLDQEKRLKKLEEWDKIQTKEDSNGELTLEGVRVYECDAEESALSLLFLGNMNRITSSTKMNLASSRSHAIFTISTTRTVGKKVETGKMHVVDLAGSERSGKTNDIVSEFKLKDHFVKNERRKSESVDINLSLHYLQRVIYSLQLSSPHIPYRNSLMTQILKSSLGGNSNTIFIGCLSLESENVQESLSTLNFLTRCGSVQVKYSRNISTKHTSSTLTEEIKSLNKKLKEKEDALNAVTKKMEKLKGVNRELKERVEAGPVTEKIPFPIISNQLVSYLRRSASTVARPESSRF
ncbi:hypothetical protein TrLO_g845 [Triparma laevis f. longispina]|uniref:Kinesin-like protein n=1 Tax=Triparma laevis f. longispina TaxID=1714387 RepID=A0A9W7KZA9_9STRA|nr:hypothetical protein TrLO_g845 [Triparma laevis f. longispina]